MRSGHTLPLIGILLLPACGPGDETAAPQAVTLSGDVINDGDFLAKPTQVHVVGESLVVADAVAPHVHVMNLSDGRHLATFGRSGGGPGELNSATEVQQDPSRDGSFWVFDLAEARLTRFRLSASAGVHRAETLEVLTLQLRPGTWYFQPTWLSDSLLVSPAIYPEGRLVLARRSGEPIRTIGQLPPSPPGQDIPANVRQHAFTGPAERSPDGSRIVVATRHGDLLEIFRPDGSLVRSVRGSFGFEPKYVVQRRQGVPTMGSGEDLRFGYVDLAATDRYLFALFSGDRRGDVPGRATFGKQVHVFDWDGNKLKVFDLDERALGITVDPTGGTLYAIRWDPKPAVVRYSLRGHLPGSPNNGAARS